MVFLGRFVTILRVLTAVLAGLARMDWRRFLLANAAGAILWASTVGFGVYLFGRVEAHVTGPLSVALVVVGFAIIVWTLYFVRAHEAELEAEAERALRAIAARGFRSHVRRSKVRAKRQIHGKPGVRRVGS